MRTCHHCGGENRDGARFCVVCGRPLPAAPPSAQRPIVPARSPFSPTAVDPQIIIVPHQPAAHSRIHRRGWREPLVEGRVSIADPERDVKQPFDTGRALVISGLLLVGLGLCALSAFFALALFIVLLALGLGSICLLPVLIPLLTVALGPLIYWMRGDQRVGMIEFQVDDIHSSGPVSVVLYRKEGGSAIRLGDRVRVFGRRQKNTNNVYAHRIEVCETNGRPANHAVVGIRPWPVWLGLMVLGAVIAGYTLICFGPYLQYYFER